MSTPAPAAAATPPPVAHPLDEFSDRISPMLVKELRQGLRAKTFVIVFLALQAMLAVVLLAAIGASSSEDAGRSVSTIIFLFFSLAVVIVQPLRGIGALHNEIKGNTIDLMVLTRLGAWRIVLGKWVSIVSQSALLLTAIAPYLILRYFFGRMNLFAELNLLLLIFLASALFTAITVGLSAIPSILIRGLLPLVMALYIGAGTFAASDDYFGDLIEFCALQEDGSGWALLAGLVTAAYFGWSSLALGASMIAPMAENHSTVRRLLTLAVVAGFAVIATVANFDREAIGPVLLLFCAPAIAIAVTEPLQLLPPICRPFLRFGAAGKLAGRFLYPGWPSGILFSGLLIALGVGAVLLHLRAGGGPGWAFDDKFVILMLGALGTLLLPGLLIRLMPRRIPRTFSLFLLFAGILIGTAIGLSIVAEEVENDSFMWAFAWIPPVQFNLMDLIYRDYYDSVAPGATGPPGSPDYQPLVLTGIATCSIYYLGMLLFALRNFRSIREVEEEAATITRSAP